jgi:3-oxoacyl-(acyl-carrier-protein) synthase
MLVGSSECSSPYVSAGFDAMRVMARGWNQNPHAASRPLSASAAGFVPASGAGALLLESLDSAEARGAKIYAEVLGGAVNCGGQRNGGTTTASNSAGARNCIQMALADAGVNPGVITYINGHLTATMADPKEISNLEAALGRYGKAFPFINSTKSLIGHALGASGSLECVATVIQIAEEFLHPSTNCADLHPDVQHIADSIVMNTKSTKVDVALKTSFGFGDVNACLVFSKYSASQRRC